MLTVGTPAPELDHPVTTIDGEETTLEQLAGGNPLLLILFKTSCKSCKVGLPFASTLVKRLQDAGAPLSIVTVTQDSANVTRSFRRRYDVDLPFVVDPTGFPLSVAYDIEATPTWFLIGKDGLIKNTGFGVFHHPFVDDPVYPARHHPVEVRHQPDVVHVEAGHVHELIAEQLAARVKLLEIREATGERMPARIDDLRVGEDGVNHPDVEEVVGHLVDEERPRGLALDAGVFHVLLAQRA